jgi:uridylate kinase
LDERYLDDLGIDATRLNARLIIGTLGGASNPLPAVDYDQVIQAAETYDIVIMGGVEPGLTTDGVSAELAIRAGARRLVNATSVDGVYTADPRKDPGAKRLTVMTHRELVELVGPPKPTAGPTAVFDPVAARLMAKALIPVCVVHGRNLAAMEAAIREEKFEGTLVVTQR